jgi:hypothetical protein
LGKILGLAIFSCGFMQGWAQAQVNWQASRTILSPIEIENKIKNFCMPIDPVMARDGHSCYVLQRQCWMDNSGYGPCVVKNCRYALALDSTNINAHPKDPLQYNWYCELTYDPTGNSPPGPAVVPPPECSILGEAWKHRITSDPSCAP